MPRRASCSPILAAAVFGASFAAAALPARAMQPVAAACTAAPPAEGVSFSGPVLQVLDGGRLCIAAGPTPDQWVQVRPAGLALAADTSRQAQRAVLTTAAFSKRLDCIAGPTVDGAVQAVCTIQGAPLSAAVQDAGQQPPWRLWR